jgi:acyl carrier protein
MTEGMNAMESSSIEQRVVRVVSEVLKVTREEVTPQTRFIDDLGADSLDLATLVMALEDEFAIEVPDDQDVNLTTVAAVVEAIAARADKPA